MVLVVEVPVHPVGSVHVKVYGLVPPLAAEVQVKAFPDVTPLVGHVTVTTTGCPATVTLAEALAVFVFESRAAALIEYVPFGVHMTEIVAVVDVPVQAAGSVHVNV